MGRAVFDHINIVSARMRETIAFYRLLGVEIPDPPLGKSGEPFHVNCNTGGDTGLDLDSDAFSQTWNESWRGRTDLAGRIVITFHVETREAVDELYGSLTRAGHKALQKPWDAFWGSRYAIVEDPNGVAVGIMSPQDGERQWPPEGWRD